MTGFPPLNDKGKEYITDNENRKEKHSSRKVEREEIIVDGKVSIASLSNSGSSRKEKRSSKKLNKADIDELKKEHKWDDLMNQIIRSGETRTVSKDKAQETRKKKCAVMKELVLTKETPRKKIADKKKEFTPTAYLGWTPFKNSTIVWEAYGNEINPKILKQYSLMPSMMIFYETNVATFGTYEVEPPMLINEKVVFRQKYTVFVIDHSKRLEKRLKITNGDAKVGHDVIIASGNHTITEMSEGLAIYLKHLPPYHNEDIFYQNSYHYIKSIIVASFYD
ncbi:hypothetical protein EHI_056250 [Entamoeba histolytica HM-1:IMSS]|uniref:Uncharacterized protein n=8 Tax=Entamoeba TaxID=5758 RepID=C4M8R2_ENTH1|nr:hypothetical protein ENU1_108860 [Entamoeba nuttalli P19]XP_649772.2 hypothetical protein EHI_056250 [Entamoeba histolytica HM-1:IMSS]EMD48216.1 Hypothetical protein EHI5A_140680 [Entamoeba histolytica KU27]ENY61735.1 hypothetical protein EHI7A_188890 [Entamoeba histolytica HM-1:IMSS-A]EAL44383.2 hypothetical protein EHI_056250 [Entamoeba histolytica HM-1:IMSS]EKE39940.1 hypothetical protein ENU1_108860 [Entamoeba nuttalli P19]|eukprot:XP_008857724.1 hypothetical protein ENU1_108860 [Entamoeba nuttalli P19]